MIFKIIPTACEPQSTSNPKLYGKDRLHNRRSESLIALDISCIAKPKEGRFKQMEMIDKYRWITPLKKNR